MVPASSERISTEGRDGRFPAGKRLARLRARMAAAKIDSILISSLPNVQYLTGFSGSAGALRVSGAGAVFFTDSRYDIQAREEVTGAAVEIVKGDALTAAAKRAGRGKPGRVGFEAGMVSFQAHQRLRELAPRAKWVPTVGLVEALRIEKDEGEIALIRKAVELGSRAFEETLALLRPGMTELEVAAEIEYRFRKYGGERPAFETIVASGPRAALPHARASTRRIRPKEFILMDLGVILGGYASDMTRTVFLGKAPAKAARVYRAVREAVEAAEQVVEAGRAAKAVDASARRVLRRYGYERYFTHSLGHGLGMEVHELPRVSKGQTAPLPEGATITIEPGVYLEDYGGVRIEDVVVVRQGGAELLTPTSKELMEL
ncbi:MAG: aminopeptidase P family protein [Acidobacteria bacterium]|nr:aminopeptidase P family protein [Acidobacteriota bacterium]